MLSWQQTGPNMSAVRCLCMHRRYSISKSAVSHSSQSVSRRKWEATSHLSVTVAINMPLFTVARLSLRSASKPQAEQPAAAGKCSAITKKKKTHKSGPKRRDFSVHLSAVDFQTQLKFYHQIFHHRQQGLRNSRLVPFSKSGHEPQEKLQTPAECRKSSDIDCAQSVPSATHLMT